MSTATANKAFTEFATKVYEQQEPEMKKEFIDSLADRLQVSIEKGEQDIKDGNMLTLEEFQERINNIKL